MALGKETPAPPSTTPVPAHHGSETVQKQEVQKNDGHWSRRPQVEDTKTTADVQVVG